MEMGSEIPESIMGMHIEVSGWEQNPDYQIAICSECGIHQGPEFYKYQVDALERLIQSQGIGMFWEWLDDAIENQGDFTHEMFTDGLIRMSYKVHHRTVNHTGRTLSNKPVLEAVSALQGLSAIPKTQRQCELITELLSELETTEDQPQTKLNGKPWITFAVDLIEYATCCFPESPLTPRRAAEITTVISGQNINRQSIKSRLEQKPQCNSCLAKTSV